MCVKETRLGWSPAFEAAAVPPCNVVLSLHTIEFATLFSSASEAILGLHENAWRLPTCESMPESALPLDVIEVPE